MFKNTERKETKQMLEDQLKYHVTMMGDLQPYEDDYKIHQEACFELTKLIKEFDNNSRFNYLKNERVVTSLLGLVGVVIITNYEREDIITSKAFGIVSKLLGS